MPFEARNVLKIVTDDGCRGTGYPITRDRVITAGHVVESVSVGEEVKLFWNDNSQPDPMIGRVLANWFLPSETQRLDLAVIEVELPTKRQPLHRLMLAAPKVPVRWNSIGFSNFGKRYEQGGDEEFGGNLNPFRDDKVEIDLKCQEGRKFSTRNQSRGDQFAGASGAPVFADELFMGVITEAFEEDHVDADLVFVSLSAVLRDDFRLAEEINRTIGFDNDQRRKHRGNAVTDIAKLFARLDDKSSLLEFGRELDIHDLDGNKSLLDLGRDLANRCIDKPHLDVLETLIGANYVEERRDVWPEIARYFLPISCNPRLVTNCQHLLNQGQTMLIQTESGSESIAEIITAGVEEKPLDFRNGTFGGAGFRFKDMAAPDRGPEVDATECQAHAWLYQMLAAKGNVPDKGKSAKDLANDLYGELSVVRAKRKRAAYCVFSLSEEWQIRDEELLVIERIHKLVNGDDKPVLFFVEVLPQRDRDAAKLDAFIRVLFPQTESGAESK